MQIAQIAQFAISYVADVGDNAAGSVYRSDV